MDHPTRSKEKKSADSKVKMKDADIKRKVTTKEPGDVIKLKIPVNEKKDKKDNLQAQAVSAEQKKGLMQTVVRVPPGMKDGPPQKKAKQEKAALVIDFKEVLDRKWYVSEKGETVRLGELLGRGSFGKVFSAKSADGSLSAVKTMFSNEDDIDVFRKEADILMLLSGGPCMPKMYGFTELQGGVCLRMSVEGPSLAARIKNLKGKLYNMKMASTLMLQVTSGLCFMHSRGVAHFDLKSENLCVNDDCRVCIVDFGHSKTQLPVLNRRFGTVRYFPPEMILMLPVSTWSDIWSFGMICVEVFTGGSTLFPVSDSAELYCWLYSYRLLPKDAFPHCNQVVMETLENKRKNYRALTGSIASRMVELRKKSDQKMDEVKKEFIRIVEKLMDPYVETRPNADTSYALWGTFCEKHGWHK